MTADSEQLVTKGFFKRELKKELKKELKLIDERMYTKEDHQDFVKHLFEIMYTKQDHERFLERYEKDRRELLGYLDAAMVEIQDAQEDRKLHAIQVLRIDDLVVDHEKRIRVLEG